MLGLTRNEGQSIWIELEDGRKIEIKVCYITGGKVRLGIDAPKSIKIERDDMVVRLVNRNESDTVV